MEHFISKLERVKRAEQNHKEVLAQLANEDLTELQRLELERKAHELYCFIMCN